VGKISSNLGFHSLFFLKFGGLIGLGTTLGVKARISNGFYQGNQETPFLFPLKFGLTIPS